MNQNRALVETLQVLEGHLKEKSEPGYMWPPLCCGAAIKLAEQQGALLAEALDVIRRVAGAAGTAAHHLARVAPDEAELFRADEALCREILAKAEVGATTPDETKPEVFQIPLPLEAAVKVLQQAEGVVFDSGGHVITFHSPADLNGTDENEFLSLGWVEEGQDFEIRFAEGNNRLVTVSGSDLFLTDTEGDEVQVTPLYPMELAR